MTIVVRNAHQRERIRSQQSDETEVQQNGKELADAAYIVKAYQRTGELPRTTRQPMFGDFVGVQDFQHMTDTVAAVQQDFDRLPATVRTACGNDPRLFLEKLTTLDGVEELREAGLLFEDQDQAEERIKAAKEASAPVEPPAQGATTEAAETGNSSPT